MELSSIRDLCLKLPGVTEDIKWEAHLCFNVGGKMFLITSPDEVPVNASMKVSEENFASLSVRPGLSPAPYLARHHWIRMDSLDRFSVKEWKTMIAEAHRLVALKLPKATRKKLGLVD